MKLGEQCCLRDPKGVVGVWDSGLKLRKLTLETEA